MALTLTRTAISACLGDDQRLANKPRIKYEGQNDNREGSITPSESTERHSVGTVPLDSTVKSGSCTLGGPQ
jgi:hypothetical protein